MSSLLTNCIDRVVVNVVVTNCSSYKQFKYRRFYGLVEYMFSAVSVSVTKVLSFFS